MNIRPQQTLSQEDQEKMATMEHGGPPRDKELHAAEFLQNSGIPAQDIAVRSPQIMSDASRNVAGSHIPSRRNSQDSPSRNTDPMAINPSFFRKSGKLLSNDSSQ